MWHCWAKRTIHRDTVVRGTSSFLVYDACKITNEGGAVFNDIQSPFTFHWSIHWLDKTSGHIVVDNGCVRRMNSDEKVCPEKWNFPISILSAH
jgi:hypothetical protein